MQNSYSKGSAACEVTYAGFWVRLLAYLIDSAIVFAVLLIARLILSGVMGALEDTFLGGNILFQYTLKDIVLYVLEAAYFILFTYYTGTTLGKRLLNLRVVRADGQEKLSFLSVVYRETVGRFLSGVICALGYLLIVVDKEKRGLHDILSDTRVIYAKTVKVYEKTVQYTEPVPYASEKPMQESAQMPQENVQMPQESMQMPQESAPMSSESAPMSQENIKMPWEAAYTPAENDAAKECTAEAAASEDAVLAKDSAAEQSETERDS